MHTYSIKSNIRKKSRTCSTYISQINETMPCIFMDDAVSHTTLLMFRPLQAQDLI